MKHSKLYTHLGITGALLVPALAVAAIEVPNVFEGGDPVSASQMNENFQMMAEAIDELEARVETLESQGLQPPVELNEYSAPLTELKTIYQVHTDGVMTARVVGNGATSTDVRFDISDTEEGALNCDGSNCTAILGRGYDGSSSSVFVPAGYYVAARMNQMVDEASGAFLWQPLRGPDPAGKAPTFIESSHP